MGAVRQSLRMALSLQIARAMVDVAATSTEQNRRARGDRRAHSRSGRRRSDPRTNWRRVAWLFAAYAVYLSFRSLSATVSRLWRQRQAT
jgi:hypothetical protein